MAINNHKIPVLALSACSIPVMLAFAGIGNRPAGLQSPAITSGDVAVSRSDNNYLPLNDSLSAEATCTTDELTLLGTEGVQAFQADASWICTAPDQNHFWVTNGRDSAISTYRFTDPVDSAVEDSFELVSVHNFIGSNSGIVGESNSEADNWVDLDLSEDGQWLYQIFGGSGAVAVYEVEGHKLTLVELLSAV